MISTRGTIKTAAFIAAVLSLQSALPAHAATEGNFALQITPSPLVQVVKPGVASSFPLQVRNNGTTAENLKVDVRRFSLNNDNGQIAIDDTTAPDLAKWVTFASPKFSVNPGQVFSQNVTLSFPKDSGFSYSFVMLISRQSAPQATGGGQVLQGTIADFGLVNIDRPGATSALEVSSFKSDSGVYEYVPATLSLTFKNTGNTFLQPGGNIFIGRDDPSASPIATLPVNDAQGYILPGTSRTINTVWNDGFPHYNTETLGDGTVKKHEVWNWGDLGKFRIGKYTARTVAIYKNGDSDIPINAQVSFWVIPWKILLVVLLVVVVIGLGLFLIIRTLIRGIRHGVRAGRR